MAKGETILITGGTSVVGKAIIPDLIAQGYEVIFTSRNEGSDIEGATCIAVDLLQEGAVETLLPQLKSYKISYLINNFRDVDNLKTDEKARPSNAQWLREYQAAVSVPYALSMALADQGNLRSVINITSVYGITAGNLNLYAGDQRAAPIHYNVAKAAEIHLTKEMAVRLADQNIRVNAVAYGGVKGRADQDFEKKYESLCPFEGMLETSDLAGAVFFLLSEKAAGKITGQTLQVDGGWTLW